VASLSAHRTSRANDGSYPNHLEPGLHALATLLLEIAKGQAVIKTEEYDVATNDRSSDSSTSSASTPSFQPDSPIVGES
jgi:hypothetical protein